MSEAPTQHLMEPDAHSVAPGRRHWILWGMRVAQVRLRFLLVLLAGFLIVGKWNVLRNYWDTLTTRDPTVGAHGGVSGETEYFCPMCPGVVSVWPTKCSVCNMPLVLRKKGDAQQLPDGVLARMQLSPYRVYLAGIQTAPVKYRPLVREVMTTGIVSGNADAASENGVRVASGDRRQASGAAESGDTVHIAAEIDQRNLRYVVLGTSATVVADIELAGEPHQGHISRIEHAVSLQSHRLKFEVAVDGASETLWPGMTVQIRIHRPITELEPFRSQPSNPPPIYEGEPRKLYTCHQHPHVLYDRRGTCPEDGNLLMDRPLDELERVSWWCPVHPHVTASERGHTCDECNGMQLVPQIVQYRPEGQVLAVPESAVIDLGDRRVVYVEQMPGMFDALEVTVGPRCGGYYPVMHGLEPGQRVAATGAFLLDAETRLNPSVAAGYFGASLKSSPASAESKPAHRHQSSQADEIDAELEKLSPTDRASAKRQQFCPITGMPLGSMGAPVKIELQGRSVWLCCPGCEVEASEKPEDTITKLNGLRKQS